MPLAGVNHERWEHGAARAARAIVRAERPPNSSRGAAMFAPLLLALAGGAQEAAASAFQRERTHIEAFSLPRLQHDLRSFMRQPGALLELTRPAYATGLLEAAPTCAIDETGGDDACWSGDFTFDRCCSGGLGGAPASQPLSSHEALANLSALPAQATRTVGAAATLSTAAAPRRRRSCAGGSSCRPWP